MQVIACVKECKRTQSTAVGDLFSHELHQLIKIPRDPGSSRYCISFKCSIRISEISAVPVEKLQLAFQERTVYTSRAI